MAISNINNNNTTQLQAYGQEKLALTQPQPAQETTTRKTVASTADSVQISDQAKALLAKEVSATTLGNGGGIIPPGNAPIIDETNTTLGNGGGIIPPGNAPISDSTLGNGGGIIPPGNTPETEGRSATLGNGGGIIPPGN